MGASLHSRHVTRCDPFSAGYDPWILQTALQTAANNGHITTVELLLAQGADTNARDSCSRSVLHTVVLQEEYGWRSTPEIITLLLDRCADVNALDNTGCSVLKAAMSSYCSRACVVSFESKAWMDTIRLLVERGADPRTCSNTLGELSGAGLEATQYLLDKGADVNQPDPSGETALHKAVNNREMDAFRLLIERGASVNAIADATSPSVLQAACYSRHGINYLPGLLNEGADPAAPPGCWGSAIHAICLDGLSRHEDDYLDMVRMVLDAGADVNAEGGQYGYPLQAAAAACWGLNRHHWHGREVVESLLNSGAHVNAQGGKYGSALQAACWVSDPHLVRLLLGRDADPNAAGGEFGNPLTAAVGESTDSYGGILSDKRSFTRVLDIVEMLLGAGAHVNARGNRRHGTALHAAAANASVDVVRLLLKRGANINGPKGGLYGSALQAACAKRRGDSSVPRLLLEHGADVLARGGQYGSAFHAAVVTRNVGMYHENRPPRPLLDTLDLLLASEPPLDVNDTGGTGGSTAIQGLMGTQWSQRRFGGKGQELEIIMLGIRQKLQLLVEHGVDVNLGGGKYGSPLQAACALHSKLSFGRAELLLELFPAIEVNNLGGFFGSPLQAAAYSGQTETVRMLLKRKADIHVRGGHYGSALNAAILGGKWDIVKILRVAGAKADCEISEVPDQLWLWQMEREEWEEYVYIFDSLHDYKQYGEDAVERYEKFWEVETGKEIPVDRVLEWLFG
jgi:ankyrin repeat protein